MNSAYFYVNKTHQVDLVVVIIAEECEFYNPEI